MWRWKVSQVHQHDDDDDDGRVSADSDMKWLKVKHEKKKLKFNCNFFFFSFWNIQVKLSWCETKMCSPEKLELEIKFLLAALVLRKLSLNASDGSISGDSRHNSSQRKMLFVVQGERDTAERVKMINYNNFIITLFGCLVRFLGVALAALPCACSCLQTSSLISRRIESILHFSFLLRSHSSQLARWYNVVLEIVFSCKQADIIFIFFFGLVRRLLLFFHSFDRLWAIGMTRSFVFCSFLRSVWAYCCAKLSRIGLWCELECFNMHQHRFCVLEFEFPSSSIALMLSFVELRVVQKVESSVQPGPLSMREDVSEF